MTPFLWIILSVVGAQLGFLALVRLLGNGQANDRARLQAEIQRAHGQPAPPAQNAGDQVGQIRRNYLWVIKNYDDILIGTVLLGIGLIAVEWLYESGVLGDLVSRPQNFNWNYMAPRVLAASLPITIILAMAYLLARPESGWKKVAGGLAVFVAVLSAYGAYLNEESNRAHATPQVYAGVQEASSPLTSLPSNQWPNWLVKAHSNSKSVTIPFGMLARFGGGTFVIHLIYDNGVPECLRRSGTLDPCPPNPQSAYVENPTDFDEPVSYAFEPSP